jgi:transposase
MDGSSWVQAGIGTHKDSLALAVIDDAGRVRHRVEVPNTEAGFERIVELLAEHGVRRVGIEGSGNYWRAAAVHLSLLGGVEVVEVPPGLTSRERAGRPGQGKTDPGDATAIARIVARESDLPAVRLAVGAAADLRALLDYRDELLAERVAMVNRVQVELAGLRPGYHAKIPQLTTSRHLAAARELLNGDDSVRAQLVRRRLDRIVGIDAEMPALRAQIKTAVAASQTSLVDLYGAGDLVAARVLAEVVDVRRYPTRHAFAAANGSAPIPASSGRTVRHRLNRGGNRQLNRALYTMAITQIRADTDGRAYYRRKRAEGKTGREALRCLKRRLSDQIYKTPCAPTSTDAQPRTTSLVRH